MAEIPKAYYASEDNPQQYEIEGLIAKEHKQGYRSIHYIICYGKWYVELQVRTIYDEAWSDCDHNYVYKYEANPNNRAFSTLSQILCKLTNVANDIGDNMYDIYNEYDFSAIDGEKWKVSNEHYQFYQGALGGFDRRQNN